MSGRDAAWITTDHTELENIGSNTHAEIDTHITNATNAKNNYTATSAPTVTDDSDAGYSVGSEWVDVTADKAYKCLDASVGAAVWTEVTSQGETNHLNLSNIGTNTHAKIDEHIVSGATIMNLRAGDFILNHDTNFAPVETLTGSNISRMVDSFDYATPEFVRHEFIVPATLNAYGEVVFEIAWKPRVAPAEAENVVWEIESIGIASGENWDQALVSRGTLIASGGMDVDEITKSTHGISVSDMGWAAGDMVVLRVSRDADNANDSLDTRASTDDDALLFGLSVKIPLA